MKALLIVDVQNDFCTGGSLAVPAGEKVVPVVNRVMERFKVIVASKDWHPEGSKHFEKWPVHCVQYTSGAAFYPQLNDKKIERTFLKGTDEKNDGYSAFDATSDDLEGFLRGKNVNDLYVCGLATDYCVLASALDARRKGFNVFVIEDAIKGVDAKPGDSERAIDQMKHNGVVFVDAAQVPA